MDAAEGVETVAHLFATALNEAALDAAASCFAADACLLTGDRATAWGRDGIREVLARLIAAGTLLEPSHRGLVVAGDVAVQPTIWTARLRRRPARTVAASSTSVLRRVERTWKLQIASPLVATLGG